MTKNIDTKKYHDHDLVFQGAKEAIDSEVRQLYEEGCPVLTWKNNKVVNICQKLYMQESGRSWFLIGIALLVTFPIFVALISIGNQAMPVNFFKSIAMLIGIICFGLFGLGAWYGDKKTCRNCLIFTAIIFPIWIYLLYSYFVNGFF